MAPFERPTMKPRVKTKGSHSQRSKAANKLRHTLGAEISTGEGLGVWGHHVKNKHI